MNLEQFEESLSLTNPPKGLNILLTSLWFDAKGDWHKAHDLINDLNGNNAAWVHAYLHRKEGDLGNAGYWYRRAGKNISTQTLQEEWTIITKALLQKTSSE
jgi:hypothetical protein